MSEKRKSAYERLYSGSRTIADQWGPAWLAEIPAETPPTLEKPAFEEPEGDVSPFVQVEPTPAPIVDGAACPRCGCQQYVDTVIHNGESLRRDCFRCHRTLGFPRWYGREAER